MIDSAYESYRAWVGDGPMPEGVFAMLRECYKQVEFQTLHRWWLAGRKA